MKLTLLAVGTSCALIVIGCSRETTDQGGVSQEPATGVRQDSAPSPATTPATPPPVSARQDLDGPQRESPANEPADADNTGRNVRDRSEAAVTPGDQSEARSDVELTRQIRQAIVANDQLSISADNIKIITANGKVTLRGPVRSAAERDQIVQIVQGQAGVAAVDNQLEITQDQ